jgi:arsenate reductase
VIDYLKTGWTKPQLLGLFAAAGLTPQQALRSREPKAAALSAADDATVLAAMIAEPVLVERPIVCSPKGVRLCRPSEQVIDLLEHPLPEGFAKEDGTPFAR